MSDETDDDALASISGSSISKRGRGEEAEDADGMNKKVVVELTVPPDAAERKLVSVTVRQNNGVIESIAKNGIFFNNNKDHALYPGNQILELNGVDFQQEWSNRSANPESWRARTMKVNRGWLSQRLIEKLDTPFGMCEPSLSFWCGVKRIIRSTYEWPLGLERELVLEGVYDRLCASAKSNTRVNHIKFNYGRRVTSRTPLLWKALSLLPNLNSVAISIDNWNWQRFSEDDAADDDEEIWTLLETVGPKLQKLHLIDGNDASDGAIARVVPFVFVFAPDVNEIVVRGKDTTSRMLLKADAIHTLRGILPGLRSLELYDVRWIDDDVVNSSWKYSAPAATLTSLNIQK